MILGQLVTFLPFSPTEKSRHLNCPTDSDINSSNVESYPNSVLCPSFRKNHYYAPNPEEVIESLAMVLLVLPIRS